METKCDPMLRRRVGAEDPQKRIHMSIRLSREAGRIIAALRQPGILFADGCSKGDVLEQAIRLLAVNHDVPAKAEAVKRRLQEVRRPAEGGARA